MVDFIEFVQKFDIEKLNNPSDGAIINYIAKTVYHCYIKRMKEQIDQRRPIVLFEDLSEAEMAEIEYKTSSHEEESVANYFPNGILTDTERMILLTIHEQGYSAASTAKLLHTSRQNINQIKLKAEKKLRDYYASYPLKG